MAGRALFCARLVLRRVGLAVVATAAVVGTMSPLASAEPVPTADEAVMGPYGKSVVPEYLYSAGRSGFLHHSTGGRWQWTDYATGESTTPDIPTDGSAGRIFYTHADTIAYRTGTSGVVLIEPVGGDKRTLQLPEGFAFRSVQGDTVLGVANGECHLFRLTSDGSLDDRLVTDVPSGATCGDPWLFSDIGDGNGVVVSYRTATGGGVGLVDLSTARMSVLPVPQNFLRSVQITPQAIAWYDNLADAERILPRDDLQATPWSVPTPSTQYDVEWHLVGSRMLRMTMDAARTVAVVSSDGVTTKPLDKGWGTDNIIPGPDGELLVAGELNGEYGVHRLSESSDGSLQRSTVLNAPWFPSRTSSLALFQGRLDTADTYVSNATSYHERKLAVSGTPSATTQEELGTADPCGASGCPLYPTGDGRVLYRTVYNGKVVLRLVDKTKPIPGTTIATDLTDPSDLTVESVSGRYVAYRTATATVVRDLDSGAVVRTTSAAPGALWGATLWQSAGAGKVTATDVVTGTVSRTLSLNTSCTPSSVQATARYVYVECGAGTDTAYVADLADGTVRALPTGSAPGLLGDGFVVRVGADRQVTLTDVTSATPATRVLGTARGTSTGADWTVDAYGGQVAYVDADENVHVVPTGIATGALGVTDSSVPSSAHVVLDDPRGWQPRWWISKPVSSWQLTIKNRTSGKTVGTLTGGEARGQIAPSWDGWTGVTAVGVPDATYTWTLTASPADGQGPGVTKSGSVKITGAQAQYHDFVGRDGNGDLLTLNSSGAFTFQHGTGTGTFSGKTSASGWPTSAVAVPFGTGDDQCDNVLVRLSSGELRDYRPICGALKPTTPYTSLGTGWNSYDSLTAPGDLTGDSRPDLLARQKSTGDIYLFAAQSNGTLAAGKKIRTAWTYTKIVGAGDLDGDGYGDVLARDKAGTLYRYNGLGTGLLKDRVKVFSDWGASYNTIVGVGDINGDGKSDLVERDTAGNLYRNNGDGKGSFGSRVQITTGWQGYEGVF